MAILRIICVVWLLAPWIAYAQNHPLLHHSGLPIPRFVSLKASQVNMRVGPGEDYPIEWTYQRLHLPVEVIEEFGHWRKIRDQSDTQGWVHHSLLSGRRSALIAPATSFPHAVLHAGPSEQSHPIAELEKDVIVSLQSCNALWCKVRVRDYSGWTKRDALWGIYAQEQFED